ncbi:MFS transporter [Paenibacillus agricola]|uniref:MFS transporter n=1 Tax=Paenibacillus agricola TaxID=2716264 RepID=A0ABX0JGH9_9BACL|nr:MFS transporter [Paenibacillus agricola]NHN35033.1 MFS transporter [Paenibacillus agricola]
MERSIKKQLIIFSCLSSMLSFIFSGMDVVYTTFAINDIHINTEELSLMRSLRLLLSIFVVFIMGSTISRIGNKSSVMFSILLLSFSIILLILYPTKQILFIAFPLYGALSAALMVNMNVMAQNTTKPYLELSNTTYRSTFIAFSIIGPLIVGLLSNVDHKWVFTFFSCMLGLSLIAAWGYPSGALARSPNQRAVSLSSILKQWLKLLNNKPFIYFAVLTGFLNQLGMMNLILIPYKLMNHNQVTEQQYSYLITLNAIVGLIFTLAAGYFLKKYLNAFIVIPYFLCMAGNIAMGLFSNLIVVAVLFVVSNAIYFMIMAPHSLWISTKLAGDMGNAFSLTKMISSLIGFLLTLILSFVQPSLGIDGSMVVYSVSGLFFSFFLYLFLFREEKAKHLASPYKD